MAESKAKKISDSRLVENEIIPIEPTSTIELYQPANLDQIVDLVAAKAEQSQLELMITDHNLQAATQEKDQLVTVAEKLAEIRRNEAQTRLKQSQINAAMRFNDMVKKQVEGLKQ